MNPLDRLSSFYYRIPGLSWLSRLSKPGLRRALAVVVAIVLLLLLLWIAIGVLPLLTLRFWQLAGLCAIAAAVLWWVLVGAKHYSLHGCSSNRIGELGPGTPVDKPAPQATICLAFYACPGIIRASPQPRRD